MPNLENEPKKIIYELDVNSSLTESCADDWMRLITSEIDADSYERLELIVGLPIRDALHTVTDVARNEVIPNGIARKAIAELCDVSGLILETNIRYASAGQPNIRSHYTFTQRSSETEQEPHNKQRKSNRKYGTCS